MLVGFAFQAKMLQAWLVLPALFSAYLVAAPIASLLRRIGHVALSTLAVVVVSLSWMSAVSLVPQSSRPYVDGSCNDSLFTQVFSYNGFSRLGDTFGSLGGVQPSFDLPGDRIEVLGPARIRHLRHRPVVGPAAAGSLRPRRAWLLLPAVVAAVWLLVLQRRRPRTDPLRAAVILWSAWLLLTFGFFSGIQFLNSYYTATLIRRWRHSAPWARPRRGTGVGAGPCAARSPRWRRRPSRSPSRSSPVTSACARGSSPRPCWSASWPSGS